MTLEEKNTRLLLTVFSPNQVNDIVDFVSKYGAGTVNVIYGSQETKHDLPHLFAYADPKLHDPEDTARLLNGLSVIFLAALRQPYGNDEYERILIDALDMPKSVAGKLASQIETVDAVNSADDNWLERQYNRIVDGLRKTVNWGFRLIGMDDWEIDQKQNNDADWLFELMQLGDKAKDAKTMALAVRAKAMIDSGATLAQIGEADGVSGPGITTSAEDELVSAALRRRLPKAVMGAFYTPANNAVKAVIQSAITPAATTVKEIETEITRVINKYDPTTETGRANISTHVIETGQVPAALNLTKRMLRSGAGLPKDVVPNQSNDPMGDPLSIISLLWNAAKKLQIKRKAEDGNSGTGDVDLSMSRSSNPFFRSTGDPVYDNHMSYFMETGDIEPFAQQVIADAMMPGSGDPKDFEAAYGDVMDSYGDLFTDETDRILTGGLIANWRHNRAVRAVKRGGARVLRKQKKAKRKFERDRDREMIRRGRAMGREDQSHYARAYTTTEANKDVNEVLGDYYPDANFGHEDEYGDEQFGPMYESLSEE